MSGGNDLHSAFYDDVGSSERFKFQRSSVCEPSEVRFSSVVKNTEDGHARSRCVAALRRNYVTDNGASSGSLNMSILFVGLLEVILCKVESNKNTRKTLLKVILEKLHDEEIFPEVFEVVEQLKPLQKHYLKNFWNIIQEGRKSVTAIVPIAGAQTSAIDLQTLSTPFPKNWFTDFLNASRYEDNFEELELLGKGGFGVVYKARNRVDLAYYAVKKIFLKDFSHDNKLKILREARVIASLKHPNIVCYHTAWLEYVTKLPSCCSHSSEFSSELNSNARSNVSFVGEKLSHGKSDLPSARVEDISSESEGGIVFGIAPDSFAEPSQNSEKSAGENCVLSESSSDSESYTKNDSTESHFLLDKVDNSLEIDNKDRKDEENGGESASFGRQRSAPSFSRSFSCPNAVDVNKINKRLDKQCLDVASLKYSSRQDMTGCFALFIQMQLYDSNLKDWVTQRNLKVSDFNNSCNLICHKSNLRILEQIASALSYIHSRNIVHRDLKLQNIFIDLKSLQIWIGDFGLARRIDQVIEEFNHAPGQGNSNAIQLEVRKNDVRLSEGIGSYPYVAPELLDGTRSYSSKVDIFSLGIILFELYQPFATSMERAKTIQQLKRKGIVPDSDLKTRLSDVCNLIERLVSVDPNVRPSADEILGFYSSYNIHVVNCSRTKSVSTIEVLCGVFMKIFCLTIFDFSCDFYLSRLTS